MLERGGIKSSFRSNLHVRVANEMDERDKTVATHTEQIYSLIFDFPRPHAGNAIHVERSILYCHI